MASARSGSPERPGKVPAGTAGDEARADPPGAPRGPARRARGGVARFLLRRALMSAAVLAAVSAVVFAATEALPGDPAQAILGRSASPQALAALRRQLRLNRPVLQQYWDWIAGLLHGQLGMSLAAQEPVTRLLADRLVNSGFLVLVAAAFSIPLSVALGCYAAWRRDRAFDHGSSIVLLVLAGLPEFVVGVLAVVLLATTVLHVLPAVSYLAPGQRPWSDPSALALPVATLVIAVAPYVARVMRASMVEVMESDYVEMARLKGCPSGPCCSGTPCPTPSARCSRSSHSTWPTSRAGSWWSSTCSPIPGWAAPLRPRSSPTPCRSSRSWRCCSPGCTWRRTSRPTWPRSSSRRECAASCERHRPVGPGLAPRRRAGARGGRPARRAAAAADADRAGAAGLAHGAGGPRPARGAALPGRVHRAPGQRAIGARPARH